MGSKNVSPKADYMESELVFVAPFASVSINKRQAAGRTTQPSEIAAIQTSLTLLQTENCPVTLRSDTKNNGEI